MQSSLNANLQRELDALHEKFNKLDAKFRRERAARKNKVQADTPKAKTLQEKTTRSRKSKTQEACSSDSHEYEYEYVDEPPENPQGFDAEPPRSERREAQTPQPAQTHLMMMNPFGLARRPNIDIRDF